MALPVDRYEETHGMQTKVPTLTLSLALATGAAAHASELPKGGEMGAGVHAFETGRITGGHFVRASDGMDAATAVITGERGLVVDGGRFRTAKPHDYTHGIELARGKSISLYNKEQPTQVAGQPGPAFDLYTAAEIKSIFASANQARIDNAFTYSDANHVPPGHLAEANALAALLAANAIANAREQVAWNLTSPEGNVTVNGGTFDFHSVNQNIIAADTGKLIWNGGKLVSSGGGGDTVLQGTGGIDILGGDLKSSGGVVGKPTAVQYDDRHKLDRDSWTLGKYPAFIINGDVNVARFGQPGPVIHLSDGMLKIGVVPGTQETAPRTHHLNLDSSSVTLQGEYRATLLTLERTFDVVATIKGGSLNTITGEELVRMPTESPSMWNMKTILEGGTINLTNGEVIGPNSAIHGGTVNLTGRHSFSSSMGGLTISGATINVSGQSFIGAIRGDSKAQSPYPTTRQDLVISGATLKFKVAASARGQELKVETDIGGIYAGDNNPAKASHPTLTIAADTVARVRYKH